MLNKIHEGHLGIDKGKHQMMSCCYWPGVNKQLEQLVDLLDCTTCIQFSQAKPKPKHADQLHLGKEILNMPWSKLVSDMYIYFSLKVHHT